MWCGVEDTYFEEIRVLQSSARFEHNNMDSLNTHRDHSSIMQPIRMLGCYIMGCVWWGGWVVGVRGALHKQGCIITGSFLKGRGPYPPKAYKACNSTLEAPP